MSDDGHEPNVWARGIPPVQVKVDERTENLLLVQAAWIMFLAISGIGLVVYIALNVMAAEVGWLWTAIVYIALGVVSWLAGEQVARFFDVDKYYHFIAAGVAVIVWGFLCLDGEAWGLPTGQIARFMIGALDFPEGGDPGAAVTSVFRAVAVGVLPIAGITTLWILRVRMMEEIGDRFHANPDLRKYEMELTYKREQDGKVSELQAELDHLQEERDKALEEVERIRTYPPVQILQVSGGNGSPPLRGIDDSEAFIRFLVDVLDKKRSPARAAWVGQDAVKAHGWAVSKAHWRQFSTVLFQRKWLDNRVTADAALAELGLSRSGYEWDASGDADA